MSDVSCAVNKSHETRRLYVTTQVAGEFWRIPVYVCVDEACVKHRGGHRWNEPVAQPPYPPLHDPGPREEVSTHAGDHL